MVLKKIVVTVMAILLGLTSVACGSSEDMSDREYVKTVEDSSVKEGESISVPTDIDEDGNFCNYVDVKVVGSFVDYDVVTSVPVESLQSVPDVFVDSNGRLKDGYSFVGVNVIFSSEEARDVNVASFDLVGIKGKQVDTYENFYHNGEKVSESLHDGGIIHLKEGEVAVTFGFFVEPQFFEKEQYYFVPEFFSSADDMKQDNYIEFTLQGGEK